jgi:hypothetical protein
MNQFSIQILKSQVAILVRFAEDRTCSATGDQLNGNTYTFRAFERVLAFHAAANLLII